MKVFMNMKKDIMITKVFMNTKKVFTNTKKVITNTKNALMMIPQGQKNIFTARYQT